MKADIAALKVSVLCAVGLTGFFFFFIMAGMLIYIITSEKRQLQFFGHINRADGLKKHILSEKICGTKSRVRHAQNTQTI